MSAYVVEDDVINRVVTFLANDRDGDYIRRAIHEKLKLNIATENGQAMLGEWMFSLNCEAVNQRYGEGEAASFRKLNYQYRPEMAERLTVFKSLQCWHYQCSEGTIDQTELYQFMERVSGWMAEMIVRRLPAYDMAKGW